MLFGMRFVTIIEMKNELYLNANANHNGRRIVSELNRREIIREMSMNRSDDYDGHDMMISQSTQNINKIFQNFE